MSDITIENILLVRDPWADLILSGIKKWEIRGTKLSKQKMTTIGIAKSGEPGIHRIYGIVDLVDCIGPLSLDDMKRNENLHVDERDTMVLPYSTTYAWVVKNPRILKTPIDYSYKNGWVIWGKGNWIIESSNIINSSLTELMFSPNNSKRDKFMNSFIKDLENFQILIKKLRINDQIAFRINKTNLSEFNDNHQKEILRNGYSNIQQMNREYYAERLRNIKKIIDSEGLLNTEPLELSKLNLKMKVIERTDKINQDIHWYLRMMQNIPSSRSIGKTADVIIYHIPRPNDGTKKHIFGIVGIGSVAYSSGNRDTLFGWTKRDFETKLKKDAALRSMIQLNCISTAIPYDMTMFRTNKLLATIPFTKEVVEHFIENRKDARLLLSIATSGFGGKTPIYNRLSVESLKKIIRNTDQRVIISRNQNDAFKKWINPSYEYGSRRTTNNCIYYHEGTTNSFCYNMISDKTKELAREYCKTSGSIKKINSLNHALIRGLQLAGIHHSIFPKIKRGIYLGMLSNDYIEHLAMGTNESIQPACISFDDLFQWWLDKERIRMGQRI